MLHDGPTENSRRVPVRSTEAATDCRPLRRGAVVPLKFGPRVRGSAHRRLSI